MATFFPEGADVPIRDSSKYAAAILKRALAEARRGIAPQAPAMRLAGACKAGLLCWDSVQIEFLAASREGKIRSREARRALAFAWAKAVPIEIDGEDGNEKFPQGIPQEPTASAEAIDDEIRTEIDDESSSQLGGLPPPSAPPPQGSLRSLGRHDRIGVPCGNFCDLTPLERALAAMPDVVIPDAFAAGRKTEAKLVPLVRLLVALSEDSVWRGDGGRFFMSERDLAKYAFQSNRKTVAKRLRKLSRMGFLSRTSPGRGGLSATGEAATYLWHDPAIPGRAIWVESDSNHEGYMKKVYDAAAKLLPTIEVPSALADSPEMASVAKAMLAIRESHRVKFEQAGALALLMTAEDGDADPDQFGASFAAIARLAGIDGEDAVRTVKSRLGHLCRLGYVSLLEVGTMGANGKPGQASEWAWHDPPTFGLARWATPKTSNHAARRRSDDGPVLLPIDDHREQREAIRDAFRPADDVDSVAVF